MSYNVNEAKHAIEDVRFCGERPSQTVCYLLVILSISIFLHMRSALCLVSLGFRDSHVNTKRGQFDAAYCCKACENVAKTFGRHERKQFFTAFPIYY